MERSHGASRLLVYRPTGRAPLGPIALAGRRPLIPLTPRRARARAPLAGALGHAALLAFLGLGLLAGPIEVAATPRGSPLQFLEVAERPRVPLDPFGLWWGVMGAPALAFADPTQEARTDEAAPAASAPAVVATVPGKRAVPFRTQLDGSRFAGSNCGPAALGMVLEAFGIQKSTEELRYRSHTYQGTWGSYTGTGLDYLARVAEDFGVPTRGLFEGRRFRSWSIADLREEVGQGHPVIVLTKYRLLPGHEGSGTSFDHYIVLWDLDGDDFVYNDPAFTSAHGGFARRISSARLEAAMRAAIIPQQAVAFLPASS
ncbi:MAG TPA: C39 family peptidase [Chloroflexota bacterium]|nr:C39 family peptidase [Chloroflexota bacterium]